MAEGIFLVRHGRSAGQEKKLTPEGEKDARQIAQEIEDREIGKNALILCSTESRAEDTALIISEKLRYKIYSSFSLAVYGQTPQGLKNLDELLRRVLNDAEFDHGPERSLIVVTHAPLLSTALYGTSVDMDKVWFGCMYEYIPTSWLNQQYSAAIENSSEIEIESRSCYDHHVC